VHVARLAGLPPEVVGRAARILRELEAGPWGVGGRGAGLAERARDQLSLFVPPREGDVGTGAAPTADIAALLERLDELDLDHMTPLEALNALAELRAMRDADVADEAEGAPDA
jgi:DNA mismatch repair protein MutS